MGLLLVGGLVRPVVAQTTCSTTDTAVSWATGTLTDLATDCTTLLGLKDTLRGSATLNWSTGTRMDQWDGLDGTNYIGGTPPRVKRLDLSEKSLTGSIPPALGDLTNLERLDLDENQLTGTIPEKLGDLTNLEHLYLHDNQLTGTIPEELGDLTSLTSLVLNDNQLTGTIPTELGSLTNLQYLYLNNNQLTGTIPTQLGSLTALIYLLLSNNRLSGTILSGLASLTKLTILYLNNNQLSGTIPSGLGSMSILRYLYLHNNQLSGTIPTQLGSSNLWYLYLNNNQLTGSIPTQLGNLTSLQRLRLDNNQLSGAIPAGTDSMSNPTGLAKLTNLRWLLLHYNQLSGTIPTELGSLTNLQYLYLHYNRLSGAVPTELGKLANLIWLYLYNNPLSGSVPSGWGGTTHPLTALTQLDLSFTTLTGTLPTALATRRDATPPTLTVTWHPIVDQTTLPAEVASVRIEWASPPDPPSDDPTAFSVGPPAHTTFPEPRPIFTLTALDSGSTAVTDRLSASVEVCLPWPAGLAAPLYLYRYQPAADATQDGRWERLTAGRRIIADERGVCAAVSQFSDFQVGRYTPPTTTTGGGGGGGGGGDCHQRRGPACRLWHGAPGHGNPAERGAPVRGYGQRLWAVGQLESVGRRGP